MDNPETLATLYTQDTGRRQCKKTLYSATQKIKQMNNTDPIKKWWCTQVLTKGKMFLLLITHPSCYSYINHYANVCIHLRKLTLNYNATLQIVKLIFSNGSYKKHHFRVAYLRSHTLNLVIKN